LISGNGTDGIAILGGTGHRIEGNYIGTDVTGMAALPNDYGVELFSGSINTIGGGTDPGAGNLISGNRYDGIGIYSDGNVIEGNRIGTTATGIAPLGNGQDGVEIRAFAHGFDNTVGGTQPGAGNVIAYNGRDGVRVTTGTGNAIAQNAVFANGAAGIELTDGGNQNEPAPVLTAAISGSGTTTIMGSVTGAANTVLVVEFFANRVCDPSGFGQGARYLGSATVTTNASGQANFTATLSSAVAPGQFVTATATDPAGNTSTFSNCQVVAGSNFPSTTGIVRLFILDPIPFVAGGPSSSPAAVLGVLPSHAGQEVSGFFLDRSQSLPSSSMPTGFPEAIGDSDWEATDVRNQLGASRTLVPGRAGSHCLVCSTPRTRCNAIAIDATQSRSMQRKPSCRSRKMWSHQWNFTTYSACLAGLSVSGFRRFAGLPGTFSAAQ
jgi:hypothetical protein